MMLAEVSNLTLIFVTFFYLVIGFFYVCSFVLKKNVFEKIAFVLNKLVFFLHTLSILLRWVASYFQKIGHAPFSNFFESLILFAWSMVFIYILIEKKVQFILFKVCFFLLLFFLLFYVLQLEDWEIKPLMPALKSNWLVFHVFTCFLAYANFAISAIFSFLFLVFYNKKLEKKRKILLSQLIYDTIALGFILLTIGIISGSIWANSAWGSYWQWDPKETWSLVTWFVYAAFLHVRYMREWQKSSLAFFSLFGFFCVLFTYLGVNFLLSGLHSYATF